MTISAGFTQCVTVLMESADTLTARQTAGCWHLYVRLWHNNKLWIDGSALLSKVLDMHMIISVFYMIKNDKVSGAKGMWLHIFDC